MVAAAIYHTPLALSARTTRASNGVGHAARSRVKYTFARAFVLRPCVRAHIHQPCNVRVHEHAIDCRVHGQTRFFSFLRAHTRMRTGARACLLARIRWQCVSARLVPAGNGNRAIVEFSVEFTQRSTSSCSSCSSCFCIVYAMHRPRY